MHVMNVAGAEVLVAETIRRLGAGIAPVIFCLDDVGLLGRQLQAEGIPVVNFSRQPGRDWRVAVRMARELRQRHVQVIHAHQYTPFFYSALARMLAGGRPALIFTEHGRHYPDIVSSTRRWSNRVLLSRLASVTNAVCEFSARALRTIDGFSAVDVGVIENGIDTERYARAADLPGAKSALGLAPDRRYVATVARFHPVKDHMTLVDAFASLAREHTDVDLLLIGDGPLRGELEARVATHTLQGRVHFLGVRADVAALLAVADLFCLTSVSEAASLTLLEAMATGLPVVVTNVGGNPEIVRNDREGLLVPRQDPAATAAALQEILKDPARARRLGDAGARRVREVYQLNRTIQRYESLYRQLAGKAVQ
jgi:glycosyltransferase involved in cell wall biosynthesis